MKLFMKKRKHNNKGMSLVELICAVAIFGVATTAVGSAMIVSAQNYSRNTYELDVQQEAQMATNLVGNLIVEAVAASFDDTVAKPMLEIEGENIKYQIEYDASTKTLNYKEIDAALNESIGVLAENVVALDTNLDKDGNAFDADKNVEVTLSIEKNGRVYEASYNTTARNGAANSIGVVEAAQILVEKTIVLEPGQKYYLPVSVVGNIANKMFTAKKGNVGDPVTLGVSGSSVYIDVGTTATGVIPIVVETAEDDDLTGLPLASESVNIKIRRVNGLNGTATPIGGADYMSGTTYKVDISFDGTELDKVYGKDFDTDYINPRQVSFTYTMSGMESGLGVNDYIDATSIKYVYEDAPYMSFKLKKDMPPGAEIVVTALALHPFGASGYNKSNTYYDTVTVDVPIKRNGIGGLSSQLRRGSDGIDILLDPTYMDNLLNTLKSTYGTVTYKKKYSVYEATYDAGGNLTSKSGAKFTMDLTDGGSVTKIRNQESKRLIPDKDYILEVWIEFYDASGNMVWPIIGTTPKDQYSFEYPLDAVSALYYPQKDDNLGTSVNKYPMTKNADKTIKMNFDGLETYDYANSYIKFKVEKSDGAGGWIDLSDSSYNSVRDVRVMEGAPAGDIKTFILFREIGHYRIMPYLENIPYKSYDGNSDLTGTFPIYNETTGEGIFYITVTE